MQYFCNEFMSKEIRNNSECSQSDEQDWNMINSIEDVEEAIKRELSDTTDGECEILTEVKHDKANWKVVLSQKTDSLKAKTAKKEKNQAIVRVAKNENSGFKDKIYNSKFMSTIRAQKAEKFLAGAAVVLVLVVALVSVSVNTCYEVSVDGENVCYISNTTELDQVLKELQAEADANTNADMTEAVLATDIEVVAKHKLFVETADEEELTQLINDKIRWQVPGAKIVVNNGESVLSFATLAEAQSVLDTLTQNALDANSDAQILSTRFYEDIVAEEGNVDANEILTTEEALATISAGKEAVKIHTVVSGESLWTIARDNGTTVSSLNELNPGLREDRLQIGQEIKLNKIEPTINVVVEKVVTVTESIPYGETVKESSSLMKGETQVVTKGVEGSKDVTYQISEYNGNTLEKVTLSEVVTKEPVNKVVNKGTAVVASSSRSSAGGTLNWPTKGTISSPYGKRGSGFHTGIDIANKKGTTVSAAAGGTVKSAGWSGGYGYCIIVDHGNGMKTRYAHLSKINCKVGDSVSRGEKIGEVGSTGNSTGPHLHFEVIINGSTKNPINYLK